LKDTSRQLTAAFDPTTTLIHHARRRWLRNWGSA